MVLLGFLFNMAGVIAGWTALIYGWGLQPLSWLWIISASIVAFLLFSCGSLCFEISRK